MYRMGELESRAAARILESGQLFRMNDGFKEVANFEKEWAAMVGVDHALCVSGGTSALVTALAGLGVGPGDEVIVPGYTFMATAVAVLAVGAIPVIVDIDRTMAIDPQAIEANITKNTKAIIPVHMCGIPADMQTICDLAIKHNLIVLEDACQADGGSYKGKRVGSWGHAGAFSFNQYKILSAGEGGALVTNDAKVYERALMYHDGGAAFRPYAGDFTVPVFCGVQYRVSELTGAILRVQLSRLEGILSDLRRIKKQFIQALTGESGISFIPSNDPEGDCGVVVGFRFESETQARAFAKSDGVEGWLPIDSGRHVYTNWEPVMKKRAGHHPAMNPFTMPQNQGLNMNYAPAMCAKTLNILSTTVYVSVNPGWTAEEVEKRIDACRKAAAGV